MSAYAVLHSFTFHNVSINTALYRLQHLAYISFTFHNVSINTDNNVDNKMIEDLTLHSTMFLLIPGRESFFRYSFHALHSTMFLLILIRSVHIQVSDPSLHSTMFLLIR